LISSDYRSMMMIRVVVMSPSFAWKLVLAIALGGVIVASARAHPPRRTIPAPDLRRLVGAALMLYAVGLAASLTHHPVLAAGLYAAGIASSALAAWLSRGADSEGPSDPEFPAEEPPSPNPDGAPWFDWSAFEAEFRAYARRRDAPDKTPVA
jgi:hypothetical protein